MKRTWPFALLLLACAIGLVVFLSPRASEKPDGLESVASKTGLVKDAAPQEGISKRVPLPDYTTPGIADKAHSTIVAGLIGLGISFGAGALLAQLLRKGKKSRETRLSR